MAANNSTNKYELLKAILKDIGKAAIAFSGGVDSAFLLKTARMTLGDNVLAIHASSILQKDKNGRMVRSLADGMGVRLVDREFSPLTWPEFVANQEDRCYHCKTKIYSDFLEAIPPDYCLLDASQLDDLSQERPGRRAIRELGVQTPLIEVDLNKKEVRRLSRKMQLPNWLSPSESCLATRIRSGEPITGEELQFIARGEEFMEGLGFSGCRVQYEGKRVIIAVMERHYGGIADPGLRREIGNFFLSLAYQQVFLTLLGRPDIDV